MSIWNVRDVTILFKILKFFLNNFCLIYEYSSLKLSRFLSANRALNPLSWAFSLMGNTMASVRAYDSFWISLMEFWLVLSARLVLPSALARFSLNVKGHILSRLDIWWTFIYFSCCHSGRTCNFCWCHCLSLTVFFFFFNISEACWVWRL